MGQRVSKIDKADEQHTNYQMLRPVEFDGEMFNTGDLVEFQDAQIEHLFLKNNYIK